MSVDKPNNDFKFGEQLDRQHWDDVSAECGRVPYAVGFVVNDFVPHSRHYTRADNDNEPVWYGDDEDLSDCQGGELDFPHQTFSVRAS